MHDRVAQDRRRGVGADRTAAQVTEASSGVEIIGLDHHVDVRAVTPAGLGALDVQEVAAHVDQRIGPPGGRGSRFIS